MPELSRAQLAVYAALAVVALMLGARWIRSGGEAASASGGGEPAFGFDASEDSAASPGGSGSFEVTDGDLVVHVAGAVRKPGVFQMPLGSRVTDAIKRAGGTTGDAAPDSINLAAPLADGQQVQVPAKVAGGAQTGGATAAEGVDGPISLGSASAEELDTIEGIGPVTAAAILEFRDQSGGVSSVDDLDQVSGIGPTTMEALRARLQP
ncbi:MAG: ComEA family DNA-binding protein [Solirubrobacterales bacterium]